MVSITNPYDLMLRDFEATVHINAFIQMTQNGCMFRNATALCWQIENLLNIET